MINKSILASLVPALLLGGCVGTENRGLESVHQPVVSRSDYALDLGLSGGELAQGEQERLAGWMTTMHLGYGDRVAIDVIDHGCGMTPGFVRDQLFRPFVSSKPAGFGIGAFEARQLVHAMGGALDVVSREGEGTRFRILLPAVASLEVAA